MRRLPVYFVVDVSESMVGEPIEQVQNGMRNIIQDLRNDPYALETVYVSVIAFAGKAKSLSPLTELYKFYPPIFPIGGGTSLGTAMNYLMDDMDRSLVKTTMEIKGDWKPIIFLFTDGNPTDNPSAMIQRWNTKYRSHCNLIAISIGQNIDTKILSQMTDNVFRLNDTEPNAFQAFFKWVTASIKTSSISVTDTGTDDIKLAQVDGINLEKVSETEHVRVDENFAVIQGKCQNTGKNYLIKFAKHTKPMQLEINGIKIDYDQIPVSMFKLIGAYPINGEEYQSLSENGGRLPKIHTTELIGQPTCPCCGNQFGLVICECGNVFCVGSDGHAKCPWCGMEGELSAVGEGGMDVNRTRG